MPHNSLGSVDSQETLVLGADLANGNQLAAVLPDSPPGFGKEVQELMASPPKAVPGPSKGR